MGETERLYGILNHRLADRDYVAGPGRGRFSIADISLLGWVNIARFSGIDLRDQFPHVQAWYDRLLARPATRRGLEIPSASGIANPAFEKKLAEGDQEAKDKEEEVAKFLADAKEKYGYKYASP